MSIQAPRRQHLWIWFLWLAGFYSVWTWLVFGNDRWDDVIAHWPIALAMAMGSYVAGSTPMGGGTVGFPILVLLFGLPATLGRDFSFAVQSIGMTSASIFILCRRQPLAWSMLTGSFVGCLVGLPLGIFWVAPFIPELWIKIVFAVVWASFGVLHLYRIGEIAAHDGMTEFDERWDFRVGLFIGLFSAASVAAVTGVGIDMVLYAALVLLCRADLKIAIPTSVLIMAFTSVLGLTLGGSSLFYMLIQRGAAAAVTSLLYLVPPTTAVMAWILFGESITAMTLAGTAITALGVGLVVRSPR
jgi:uncharacterized membrane protein YfcA